MYAIAYLLDVAFVAYGLARTLLNCWKYGIGGALVLFARWLWGE